MKRIRIAAAAEAMLAAGAGCGTPAASRPPGGGGSPSVAPSSIPSPAEGEDFAADARLLYRIAACSGSEPLPPGLDHAILDSHCDWLKRKMDAYRSVYVREAEP